MTSLVRSGGRRGNKDYEQAPACANHHSPSFAYTILAGRRYVAG